MKKYQMIKFYISRIYKNIYRFIRWGIFSAIVGIVVGSFSTLFAYCLRVVTEIRTGHPQIIFALPLGGIVIVALYGIFKYKNDKGTNLVLSTIHAETEIPFRMAPLIFISTIITHFLGGSAGREGAALQLGGSIGAKAGELLKLDEKDSSLVIMCGMSACFSALFGTPVAAAVFSMEVISVGIMYYAALVPCTVAALIASSISSMSGLAATRFTVEEIPQFGIPNGIKFFILSLIFAVASILLCVVLHKTSHFFTAHFENQYVRIIVAAVLVIIMRFLFGTTDYLGAGTDIIARSFVEQSAWYVFLLKMIFTAVTLGGGFKGGEIVPTLFVGATLGSFLAPIFGLPTGICAACGMVAVFCGVTNCPLTSLLLSIEMFGSESLKYCLLCIALSYLLSGYYSLYNSQKIMYSKYRTEFINRHSS